MAMSGTILFGFVIVHMIGNLQIYSGPEKINGYAKFLHSNPNILWGFRGVMLLALMVHIFSLLSLYGAARRARPTKYHSQAMQAATAASRTMRYGGIAIFAFVIYHLMHFTLGTKQIHPTFVDGQVYCNMVLGFKVWWVSAIYVGANVFVALHLYHGIWSLFQTLGVNNPRWDGRLRNVAKTVAAVVFIGNASFPVATLLGLLPSAGICS